MTDKENLEKIKAYIKKNYEPEDGCATSMRSHGNSDDVFLDGQDRGKCLALWALSKLAGVSLPRPHDQDFEY